jgi:hypothetical protein
LTAVPPEEWDHALYYEHSSATINGVRMVLYKSGSIGFAGKIYNQSFFDILGVLFGSSRGKALFKKVRDTKKFPTSKEMWALQELSKLGFCEGHDDDE